VYVLFDDFSVCLVPSSLTRMIGAGGTSLPRSSSMCWGSPGSTRTATAAPFSCIFGM
jgi:hypothetical protein